jgi:hypothetical protein
VTEPHYLADSDGVRWRVLDVRFALPHHPPGEWSWREPPDPAASFRCFVSEARDDDGRRITRSYRWADGESRTDLSDATLARQLQAAAWWDRRPVHALVPGYRPNMQGTAE